MLHQYFVLAGTFDQAHAAFFSRLMQERIDDDYGDFMTVAFEEVNEFIEPANEYIGYIERLIY